MAQLKVYTSIVLLAAVVTVLVCHVKASPLPDSADIIPLPPGIAYGGIPYGSVSGQLSQYFGSYQTGVGSNRREFGLQNL